MREALDESQPLTGKGKPVTHDEIIAVVAAHRDGKRIHNRKKGTRHWHHTAKPVWNVDDFEYRVAPEPLPKWLGDREGIPVREVLDESQRIPGPSRSRVGGVAGAAVATRGGPGAFELGAIMEPTWQTDDGRIQLFHGDCLEVLPTLQEQSVDLVFGSPPYCDARSYDDGTLPDGHVVSRSCEEWVEWMIDVTEASLRVSRGAVVWIAAGVTRNRNYWPACEGLMWEWYRRGGHAYRPCYWHRVGIPGSGGDQWFRADVEYAMCFKRPGPLPWTDNTAMGRPPKWAPGGDLSHRLGDGTRRNHTMMRANGKVERQSYTAPKLANPGTLIQTTVGGGHLGDKLCHENEAPFPEKLAEHFILSLCPKEGTVLDPFSGSGTTAKVALVNGRKAIAIDVRTSQADLTKRRLVTGSAAVRNLF